MAVVATYEDDTASVPSQWLACLARIQADGFISAGTKNWLEDWDASSRGDEGGDGDV